ncbi:transposase, partial [Pseudomonas aeruginosa]
MFFYYSTLFDSRFKTLQQNHSLLQAELTAFLDYEKYDRNGFNSGNSRNGNYSRTFKT